MICRTRPTLVGAAVVLAGIVGLHFSSTDAADPIAEADLKALVEQDSKNISDIARKVENVQPDSKKRTESSATRTIPANALIVAHFAQQRITGKNPADDAKWATLRDAAIKVAVAGSDRKALKDVGELAKALTVDIKADPKANTKVMPLADLAKACNVDMEVLMYQFKNKSVGGYHTETDVEEIGDPEKKKPITPEQARLMTNRLLAAMDFCEVLEPIKGFNGKKNAWDGFVKDTRAALNEANQAAAGKDAIKIQAVFAKLDASCKACHTVFK